MLLAGDLASGSYRLTHSSTETAVLRTSCCSTRWFVLTCRASH